MKTVWAVWIGLVLLFWVGPAAAQTTKCKTDAQCKASGGVCTDGTCQCAGGKVECNGKCRDLTRDPGHCGACGTRCTSQDNTFVKGNTCSAGTCVFACKKGFGDCTDKAGCETDLDSEENCGGCGLVCGAGKKCNRGACACSGGKTDCGGVCLDLQGDDANCGACGNTCEGGKSCQKGRCKCPSGQEDCSGVCRDLNKDPASCGSCANDCASHANAGSSSTCKSGKCAYSCDPQWGDCGGTKGCETSLVTDSDCGACGVTCKGGKTCDGGTCACPAGQTDCNGTCKTLDGDAFNCGACGNACKGGMVCQSGGCACPSGSDDCDGVCKDLAKDADNCGQCGSDCSRHPHVAKGDRCQAGTCAYGCDPGWGDCSGSPGCETDLTTTNDCGACGVTCSGGMVCGKGKCECPSGQSDCSGVCYDLDKDDTNCGVCGRVCKGGKVCEQGRCGCPEGQSDCDGTCKNLDDDAENCGKCAKACRGGKLCASGDCQCAKDETECAGVCKNLQQDPDNCGTCGKLCAADEHVASSGSRCGRGLCEYLCESEWGDCQGDKAGCETPVNTEADCGACGITCTGGKTCQSNSCQCKANETDCSGTCRDLAYDSDHCGACGSECQPGFQCEEGGCVMSAYIYVHEGSFGMGSPAGEIGRTSSENAFDVRITRSFLLKGSEVNQAEWTLLMGNNPSLHQGDELPVENVSWYDALAYCNALSASESFTQCYDLSGCSGTPGAGNYTCRSSMALLAGCTGYRLPTEAEWEYAARAGASSATPAGDLATTGCEEDKNLRSIAWYCGNAGSETHPSRKKAPNEWGFFDTHGNVSEWVWDGLGAYPVGTVDDPVATSEGAGRVFRGGSWMTSAEHVRSASRGYGAPNMTSGAVGLRPARTYTK